MWPWRAGRCTTSINGQSMVTDILEAAQADRCETIVVGRHSFTLLQRIFRHPVADELIRRGQGYTIWVVE
jgi:K+-sensing histidine kinase KdpD